MKTQEKPEYRFKPGTRKKIRNSSTRNSSSVYDEEAKRFGSDTPLAPRSVI
jgi:hypothetical protein